VAWANVEILMASRQIQTVCPNTSIFLQKIAHVEPLISLTFLQVPLFAGSARLRLICLE